MQTPASHPRSRAIAHAHAKPLLPWPMPETLHLYMLVAGIALGILLGPAVLGKFAPHAYDTLFVGSGDTSELEKADAAIHDFQTNDQQRQKRIDAVMQQAELFEDDESPMIGVQEQIALLEDEFAREQQDLVIARAMAEQPILDRRAEHTRKLTGLATLLLLLTVLVMLIEPILAPQRREVDADDGRAEVSPALARLITARYGLLAGWIVLALAKPDWLLSINPVVAIIVAAVVGVAAFVPLGGTSTPNVKK